jgi:hypothetical protein
MLGRFMRLAAAHVTVPFQSKRITTRDARIVPKEDKDQLCCRFSRSLSDRRVLAVPSGPLAGLWDGMGGGCDA